MNCPHCQHVINSADIAKEFARIGGRKSKRKITPEQQAAMQRARKERQSRPC